jgi:hypothetical protein
MNQSVGHVVLSVLSLGALLGCGGAPNERVDVLGEDVRAGGQDVAPADPRDPTTPIVDRTRPIHIPIGPTNPVILAPPVADLQLDGVMSYSGLATPTADLQINVTNVGDTPVTAAIGHVSVSGVILSGAQSYHVQIDLDHTMQSGGAPVFANDSGSVSTVCPLTWTTPIDDLYLGHAPDPSVQGKSLSSIVGSFVSGRPDGALCSSCHNSNSSYLYHPNVAPNGSGAIDPYLPASGDQAWICSSDPWGPKFFSLPVSTYPHTAHLKEAVHKWLLDGARP